MKTPPPAVIFRLPKKPKKPKFGDRNKLCISLDVFYILLKAAQQSMNNDVNHEKENQIDPDSLVDCTVSLDGSWQRRGYDSQNGLVTAILRERMEMTNVLILKLCLKSVKLAKCGLLKREHMNTISGLLSIPLVASIMKGGRLARWNRVGQ